MDTTLYVVVPYFNLCGCAVRYQQTVDFIERYTHTPGVQIIVVEAAFPGCFMFPNALHVEVTDYLWYKENLLNYGLRHLPPTWTYAAWIDSDLTFTCADWVRRTIKELRKMDVVQMFRFCKFLDAEGNVSSTFSSKKHPGYAWAMRRSWYNKIGGLFDRCIVGGGDNVMKAGILGHTTTLSMSAFRADMLKWGKRARTKKYGIVPMDIIHHWHGDREKRQYTSRYRYIEGLQPSHLEVDDRGILRFTAEGQHYSEKIKEYFASRVEEPLLHEVVSAST
jgi:hypothetical protein